MGDQASGSAGQSLALLNRDSWEITEQTDDDDVELNGYIFGSMTQQQKTENCTSDSYYKSVNRSLNSDSFCIFSFYLDVIFVILIRSC